MKQYSLFILILFTKGVAAKKHKEGSVHKLLMLLAVPKIQELYYNMQVLLGELGLESLDFSVTSDIKMGNIYKVTKNIKFMFTFSVLIMLGKDSGACRHACPFCEDGTPWKNPSKLNTLGSLLKWHEVDRVLNKLLTFIFKNLSCGSRTDVETPRAKTSRI